MKKIKAIGFWKDNGCSLGKSFPNPKNLPKSTLGRIESAKVANYLKSGVRVNEYLGFSYCRFKNGPRDEDMGNADLSDGTWLWPEGFWVYFEKFNILLPDEFISHIRSNNYLVPEFENFKIVDFINISYSFWGEWSSLQESKKFSFFRFLKSKPG